jgi:homoserine O-acetyltransferase/O-succinyltransferase
MSGSDNAREDKLMRMSIALVLAATFVPGFAESASLEPTEGDYIATNFEFRTGEKLPELRIHYTTLGTPHRNSKGEIDNAVLIMHGTGGDGKQFFRPQFADVLFAPGGVLDPAQYYIIMRDGIGHGKSSKPSDGLRARFPRYDYDDMVAADYELLTKGLGVSHARLIMGTSMGCMHAFVWSETYPEFMDALMPLACLPTRIVGRNRIWRALVIQAIQSDPDWKEGNYTTQPVRALRTAASLGVMTGSSPLLLQRDYPTRDAADAYARQYVDDYLKRVDANDLMYQIASSRNYDPSKGLEKIEARLVWVNSADDFINPPELGLAEQFAKRLKAGKFVLIPVSEETRGHGTHTWAALWKHHLEELLSAK